MKKTVIATVLILVGILSAVLVRGCFFYGNVGALYRSFYSPAPTAEKAGYEPVVIPAPITTEFVDVYEKGKGVILIDKAHDNLFDDEELNVLLLRLVSRGLTVRFLGSGDDLEKELLGETEDKEDTARKPVNGDNQTAAIKEKTDGGADAFIVISPQDEFSRDDTETVVKFIDKGGKMLLIADPTRRSEINSLSLQFGLLFEFDYLYNMKENETNYRNILISRFEDTPITRELKQVALYTAGSISSANSSIAFVDENTLSSLIETRTRLSPLALSHESKVLAINDLTFMTEPFNGILDNNRLIANVADWLVPASKGTASKK